MCNLRGLQICTRVQFNKALRAEQQFIVSLGATQIEKLAEVHHSLPLSLLKSNQVDITMENDAAEEGEEDEVSQKEEDETSQKDEDSEESDEKPKKKRKKGIMNK